MGSNLKGGEMRGENPIEGIMVVMSARRSRWKYILPIRDDVNEDKSSVILWLAEDSN